MTVANVLKFYEKNPFNYGQSVKKQTEAVIIKKITDYYPNLDPYINKKETIDALEVACGTGWFSNGLALHHNVWAVGIDFNKIAIKRATDVKENLPCIRPPQFLIRDLFKYIPATEARLSGKTGKFDFVSSLGVLHHTGYMPNALKKICCDFVKPEGHIFIGLYHKYGRKPFLEEFKKLKNRGTSEEDMFSRYRELSPIKDETLLRSWFIDQVLHPYETSHTLEEIKLILQECDMTLIESSIKGNEEDLELIAQHKLEENKYWPGFFTFVARKN